MVARKGRIMEWKEAFDAAVKKTVGAYEKMEEAFLSGSKEGFEHWHAEYCRYIDVFTEATGIPESQFIEIVNDAALKKKEQNKSEFVREYQNISHERIKAPEMDFPGLIVYLSTYGIKTQIWAAGAFRRAFPRRLFCLGIGRGFCFPLIPPSLAPIVSYIL